MQPDLVACHECDLLQRLPELGPGSIARCPRCGFVLARARRNSLDRALSWTLTGTVLEVLAARPPRGEG